jgi:hypothetical protein
VKTSYVIKGVDPKLCEDRGGDHLTAALTSVTKGKIERARAQFERGRQAFTPGNQPRDDTGKFRQVLARLKFDLGDTELENIVNEIKKADDHADAGDIGEATKAGKNVIQMVDEIKDGVLNPEDIRNVRNGARELAKAIAYLPLPQGDPNAKVRFTDLPKATRDLVQNMVERVETKLGSDDAAEAVANLKSLMSGGRTMTSDDLSSELNKLLRLLT